MGASVIIVGAGPAGLMLAGELRLAGIDVVVFDRQPHRTSESRGIGLTIRTVEEFDQRGLLPRFGELQSSDQGHFGGLPLDLGILGTAHRAAKTVPQSATEAVLEGWAGQLGADIRRGHEVVDLTDHGDGVDARIADGDGEFAVVRAPYLVGCDGGHSTVRKAAGFDFPGTPASTELFLADIRGVEIEPRMTGQQVPGGMVMAARLSGGIHRIIVGERGAPPRRRTQPPAFAEVADTWKRLTGMDISHAEPVWVSAFTDAARQITEYRRGRVLLAGDAAHVHLPAGGQGMNVSIQDSVNLGWKLASVLHGRAPGSLLDTYHSERHEVGRRLLLNTQAQSLLILGGEEIAPLRLTLAELLHYPEVSEHLAAKVSGTDIRYEAGAGDNPLLGMRMPHLELTSGNRIVSSTKALRAGRGVLLDLADNAVLRDRAKGWADRVDTITGFPLAAETGGPLAGVTAVLLRPDGYIAWIAPGTQHDLPMALTRWFGPTRGRA